MFRHLHQFLAGKRAADGLAKPGRRRDRLQAKPLTATLAQFAGRPLGEYPGMQALHAEPNALCGKTSAHALEQAEKLGVPSRPGQRQLTVTAGGK